MTTPNQIPPRLIPDINVFLNGIVSSRGNTLNTRLYQGFRRGLVRFIYSEEWLDEFERILTYPQVLALGITASGVAKASRDLFLLGEYVAPVPRFDWPDLGDRKDWYLLDLLLETQADALVTQDKKVLALGKLLNLPIYAPVELVELGVIPSR
jgi:uncharacterized protein